MGTRTIATAVVVTALTLAFAGCGTEDPGDDPPSGVVVLDKPWVLQFEFDNDDAGFVQSEYLTFTPKTGEARLRTVDHPMDYIEPLGTLSDAAGRWALGAHTFGDGADARSAPVYSLTGGKDLELDLTRFTAAPEAWTFVPDRPGVLHVLGADDTLVEYSLDTKKSRKVPLAEPDPGMEYSWYFSAADGMPVAAAADSSDTPDVGEFSPYGITPIDTAKEKWARCVVDGHEASSYAFTDTAGKTWDVCEHRGQLRIRSYDGKKWKVIATVGGKQPMGDLRTVLPAVE